MSFAYVQDEKFGYNINYNVYAQQQYEVAYEYQNRNRGFSGKRTD